MHWVELEGLNVPKRIGGHPGLDLCNTWAGWGEPPDPRHEWLSSYDQLAVWCLHADLISTSDARRLRRSAARDPARAATVLADVRRLRTASHAAVLLPGDTRSMAVVTGFVRRSGAAVRVEAGSPPRWSFPPDIGLELPLLSAAWAVGDLVTRADLDTVKACPGQTCGWLFLDTSGRRTWCSMSSCGNRAKVASFARRQRQSRRG